jgi:hypothetical protein
MAEKKVIELDLQTNLGSLKSQLKQAQADVQTLSDKFGATSQAAAEAAKKAADLKDRIQDAKALTDAFNPDAKFTSLTRSIGGALDGFQAFEGALGLIGVESEDLQKTLLKVQSAMAFSQGIQGALEAKDSFIQLGAVVKNTFSAMTTASKAFLVGGIGLIIAAVGLIISNYDDWFGASKKVAEQQKVISEQAKEQRENIAKESGEFATLISRLKNTNEGSKERADLIKKINGQYGTTLKNIKDETKFQESLNKELASYLEYQKAKYQLQKNEELIVKNLEKQDEIQSKITKAQKDLPALIEAQKKAQKGLNETNAQDTNMVAFYAEKVREAKAAVAAKNKEIKLEQDELIKAEKRFNAYGSAANNAANNVDKLTNSGTKYVEQTTDKVDKVEENNDKEFESYDALEYKKAQLLKHSELTLQGHVNETVRIQQEAAEYELLILQGKATKAAQIDEAAHSKKVELAKAGLSAIAQITELFGKKSEKAAKQAFKIQKAANIASALVTTYQSATAAYASQFTPLPDPSSPVRGAIAAGIAIASGLANVAKITQQKFEGGTPPGNSPPPSDAGGGGTVISPNFNVVGNSGLNQLSQLQQKPTKAYVVSGDMTTAQALDRNRIENATLVQ